MSVRQLWLLTPNQGITSPSKAKAPVGHSHIHSQYCCTKNRSNTVLVALNTDPIQLQFVGYNLMTQNQKLVIVIANDINKLVCLPFKAKDSGR